MPDEVHISSLVVHCVRDRAAGLAGRLAAMPGIEVHGGVEEGKLVLVLETAQEAEITERMTAIQMTEGVLSVALVFHQFEAIEPNQASNGNGTPCISHAAN